ncbi:hypothetical protein AX14_002468 [Amanita brunnescens Koide BX004]|nr:hypothetical protein AX14_002468 [Amanita brunnescens Koide BX004]
MLNHGITRYIWTKTVVSPIIPRRWNSRFVDIIWGDNTNDRNQFKERKEDDRNSNQDRSTRGHNYKGCSTSLLLLPLTLIMHIFAPFLLPNPSSNSTAPSSSGQINLEHAEQVWHTNATSANIIKTMEYSPSPSEFPATAMIAQTIASSSPTIETPISLV